MINNPDIHNFYRKKLNEYGASAQGMGWRDQNAQDVRFQQLIKVIKPGSSFTINDLGCGAGDLVRLLESQYRGAYTYRGYDALEEMIALGKQRFPESSSVRFFQISGYEEMETCDYAVASGIFNVRNSIADREWQSYILATITAMFNSTTKGFAFNALTRYSDSGHMRPDLFYSDPLFLFDYCKQHFSKNVALLHDYGIYDFTILVKKEI